VSDIRERLSAEEEFEKLASDWRKDTSGSSLNLEIAMNPSYQRIIGMGERALPLILSELDKRTESWFWALHAISGCDPVPEGSRGVREEMRERWLEWGRQSGYLSKLEWGEQE